MTETRPRRTGKVLKILALSLLGAFVVYELVYLGWKYSGASVWKLASDEDEIRIWTIKTPGSALLKVKGEMRIRARLSSVIAILEETEVLDKSIGIERVNVLERQDTPALYMAYHHYEHNLPMPIGPREFIIQTHHSQDPATGKVEVDILAAPNKLPPRPDIVRLTHLNNIWTLEPLPNGELDLTMIVDVDLGGNVPYFLNNIIMPKGIRELFLSIRKLSADERYLNARVAHIRELGEAENSVAATATAPAR